MIIIFKIINFISNFLWAESSAIRCYSDVGIAKVVCREELKIVNRSVHHSCLKIVCWIEIKSFFKNVLIRRSPEIESSFIIFCHNPSPNSKVQVSSPKSKVKVKKSKVKQFIVHHSNSSSSADLLCAVLTSWFPAPAAGLDGLICWNMSLVGITLELLHTPALLLGNLLTVELVSEGTLLLRYFHTLLHISTMLHRVLSTLWLGCSITWCSICRLKIKYG